MIAPPFRPPSASQRTCALCGHRGDYAHVGASALTENTWHWLCHDDTHSCYVEWTVYDKRPEGEVAP